MAVNLRDVDRNEIPGCQLVLIGLLQHVAASSNVCNM